METGTNLPNPSLTPRQNEMLICLIEECSEVIKAATKIQRHGFNPQDPNTGIVYDNRLDLTNELSDVLLCVKSLHVQNDIDFDIPEKHSGLRALWEKKKKYFRFQENALSD